MIHWFHDFFFLTRTNVGDVHFSRVLFELIVKLAAKILQDLQKHARMKYSLVTAFSNCEVKRNTVYRSRNYSLSFLRARKTNFTIPGANVPNKVNFFFNQTCTLRVITWFRINVSEQTSLRMTLQKKNPKNHIQFKILFLSMRDNFVTPH